MWPNPAKTGEGQAGCDPAAAGPMSSVSPAGPHVSECSDAAQTHD